MKKFTIAIGSDHAGYAYKEKIKAMLLAEGHTVKDCGTNSDAPCDYPDFIRPVAVAVAKGEVERGIVLGGSGKLAMWLARLKLPPKTGEGGQCHTYADEELRSYVQNDVRVERLLLRRLAGVSPLIRATKPETVPTP